jgi:hypothetical protein
MPKSTCIAGLLLSVCVRSAAAQTHASGTAPDSVGQATRTAFRNHLEQSYITLLGGVGNLAKLWFEGSVAPGIVLAQTSSLAAVVTPKIIVRMLREPSEPVRTPSYMPRVSLFFFRSRPTADSVRYWIVNIAHHSNGQEKPLFNADGTVNDSSGNFSTNYIEAGLVDIAADTRAISDFFILALAHPRFLMDPELRGHYSPYAVHAGGTTASFRGVAATLEVTGYLGPAPDFPDGWWRRVGIWTSVSGGWDWTREMGLFANAYLGPDYYNVQFHRYISVLRAGISTTPIRSARAGASPRR